MHILFCTAAKHLFGIKMCTPVSIFLSLNIYGLDLHCLLNIFSRDFDLIKELKELGNNSAVPFIKGLILVECQEFLETKIEN